MVTFVDCSGNSWQPLSGGGREAQAAASIVNHLQRRAGAVVTGVVKGALSSGSAQAGSLGSRPRCPPPVVVAMRRVDWSGKGPV